mmetsp:Transcript_23770/g.77289  ORF Transcript_23770/g.77289 Transcript_23770/m.77289 type:complete len:244 (+) Transcript_23770:489-1220(+)
MMHVSPSLIRIMSVMDRMTSLFSMRRSLSKCSPPTCCVSTLHPFTSRRSTMPLTSVTMLSRRSCGPPFRFHARRSDTSSLARILAELPKQTARVRPAPDGPRSPTSRSSRAICEPPRCCRCCCCCCCCRVLSPPPPLPRPREPNIDESSRSGDGDELLPPPPHLRCSPHPRQRYASARSSISSRVPQFPHCTSHCRLLREAALVGRLWRSGDGEDLLPPPPPHLRCPPHPRQQYTAACSSTSF